MPRCSFTRPSPTATTCRPPRPSTAASARLNALSTRCTFSTSRTTTSVDATREFAFPFAGLLRTSPSRLDASPFAASFPSAGPSPPAPSSATTRPAAFGANTRRRRRASSLRSNACRSTMRARRWAARLRVSLPLQLRLRDLRLARFSTLVVYVRETDLRKLAAECLATTLRKHLDNPDILLPVDGAVRSLSSPSLSPGC